MALGKTFTEEVKNQADIVRIVSDYITLKKRGKNYVANCPFHTEKTPSFNVNPSMQIFHCFGCNTGGDVFNFVMRMERCDFVEAVKSVAGKIGISVPQFEPSSDAQKIGREREELIELNVWAAEFFQQNLGLGEEGQRAFEYLVKRGITEQTIKELRIGYAPDRWDALSNHLRSRGAAVQQIERSGLVTIKESGIGYYDRFRGRCMFPIADAQGRIIAFGGRAMGDAEPKYLNSPETALYTKGRNLFGLNYAKEAIRRQRFAILVEGYLDFVIPFQEGVQNIVASLGTALTEHQTRLLARYMDKPRIIVNFDPDSAGVAATKRSLEMLLEQGYRVNVLSLPEGEDPDTFVRNNGASVYKQLIKKSQPYIEYILTQSMREHDMTRPAGKAETLNSILPYLAKVRDRIERAEYAEQIADRLKIDGKSVREELKRAAVNKREQLDPAKLMAVSGALPAEKLLLKLLFSSAELRNEFAPELTGDLLEGFSTEPIFAAMFSLVGDGDEIDFTRLREALTETGASDLEQCDSLLSGLMIEAADADAVELEERRKKAAQSLAAIKRLKIERQMAAIQYEINQAQREGNAARVMELSLKKHELTARRLKEHFG